MRTPSLAHGFSLIELLLAIFLIGLTSALIIPRFVEIRRQALVKVALEQASSIQTALTAWLGSYSSPAAARAAWEASAGTSVTLGAWPADFADFIDSRVLSELTFVNDGIHYSSLTSEAMRKNELQTGEHFVEAISGLSQFQQTFCGVSFTIHSPSNATSSHIMIYWPTGDLRLCSQPAVILFIPKK